MLEGEKERQGDFVFTAQDVGEYKFCFNNEMSTFADKTVDFEIAVENEARVDLPAKQGSDPLLTSALEESLFKLSGQLSTITRNQKYFRTRENRNFSTVRSTESRIFNFSLIQCCLVIAMGALQVFIVRFFFQVCILRATSFEVHVSLLTRGTGCSQGLRLSRISVVGFLARRSAKAVDGSVHLVVL